MKCVALDVDGVLADIHSAVFKYLRLDKSVEDVKRWDFFSDLGIKEELFWMAYKDVWSLYPHVINPVESGVSELVGEIVKKYKLVDLVTCRPRETVKGLYKWLDFVGLSRVGIRKVVVLGVKADKTALTDYDFFVDDNPEMAVKDRKRVILFDRPWNRDVYHVRRITSLRKLLDGDLDV